LSPEPEISLESILDKLRDPELLAKQCLEDLYFLCRAILCTLEDSTPGFKDLHYETHKTICDFVQNYAKEGNKLLILTPRGWVKSYVITIGWTIQRLLRNLTEGRREHQLISNATLPNAKNFLEKIKYNIQFNDLLRGLFKGVLPSDPETDAEKWTQDFLQIGGNLIEVGSVEGNLVSRHYKIMVNDDLVNKDNSNTKEQLLKTLDWWRLSQSLLLSNGIEINIGTRWAYDDLYGYFIESFVKPEFKYMDAGKPIIELHRGNYHMLWMDCWSDPIHESGSTFPTLFPESKLKELQGQLKERFNGQYRNNPFALGKNPFKEEWFCRWNQNDTLPAIRNSIMIIDPSGKAQIDSDYTGVTVIHLTPDKKGYIQYGKRHMITDKALVEWIINNAIRWRVDSVFVEDSKYQVIYELLEILIPQLHRMGRIREEDYEYVKTLPYILQEVRPAGRPKDVRIRHLTGFFENGQFMLPYEGAEDLEEELLRYPSTKDDVIDSLAYVLDVMIFPRPEDPPKVTKTQEQQEESEWEGLREECFVGEKSYMLDFSDID
jgi:hypothetical protein